MQGNGAYHVQIFFRETKHLVPQYNGKSSLVIEEIILTALSVVEMIDDDQNILLTILLILNKYLELSHQILFP